jgi:hypothetical protein
MFSAEILLLLGWDLSGFYHRMRLSAEDDNWKQLERTHIFRLVPIIALGIGLSLWAAALQLKITFEWGTLLLVIGALGVSVLLRRLWRSD